MQQKLQPLQANPQPKTNRLKPSINLTLDINPKQRPARIHSLNRILYPEEPDRSSPFIAKKEQLEEQLRRHPIIQANPGLQELVKKLHTKFLHDSVPEFYAYYLMSRLVSATQEGIEDHLKKQLEGLKQKNSHWHTMSQAIRARERNLLQLQRCIDSLCNSQDDNFILHTLREEIVHYRKLTKFAIGHIQQWKEYLASISPEVQFTTYWYKGEDYLLKVLNDCEFIFNTFLSRFVKFSYRNDPFILRPWIDGRDSSHDGEGRYIKLFKFEDEQKGEYMIYINYLADQRARFMESRITSKRDRIKEIQTIYHYKEMTSSRLASRSNNRGLVSKQAEGEGKQKIQLQPLVLPKPIVNNFMVKNQPEGHNKQRFLDIQKKMQKMERIKQMVRKTKNSLSAQKLINSRMVDGPDKQSGFDESDSPLKTKLRFNYSRKDELLRDSSVNKLKQSYASNYQSMVENETDFEGMLRRKQLQVISKYRLGQTDSERMDGTKTHRSFRTIKINDKLSESRKFVSQEEGLSQLEKLVQQLEIFSPQKIDNFRSRIKQDETGLIVMKFNQGKPPLIKEVEQPPSLLEQNSSVYQNVRSQVIQEIQYSHLHKDELQEKKRDESLEIQKILEGKMREGVFQSMRQSRLAQLEGRKRLAEQLKSLEVFGYRQEKIIAVKDNSEKLKQIQEELMKQMQLKWLREVQQELQRKLMLHDIEKANKLKELQLGKSVNKVQEKAELEQRYVQIERQERAKAVQRQLELEQIRRKQIQDEMAQIIQRQRLNMQRYAIKKKKEAETQLREAMKSQLLDNLKQQKQRYYQQARKDLQKQQIENDYKQKLKEKMEQQFRVGNQMKQLRDREQKLAKLKLVKEKLGQLDSSALTKPNFQDKKSEQNGHSYPEELKASKSDINIPELRQGLLPKPRENSEAEKKKLREQFQIQLFSIRNEKIQEHSPNKQQVQKDGGFYVKDYRKNIDERIKQHEQGQIQQIKLLHTSQNSIVDINVSNRKSSILKQQERSAPIDNSPKSQASEHFTRFSSNAKKEDQKPKGDWAGAQKQVGSEDILRLKLGMSVEEYQIYSKKKSVINSKRQIKQADPKIVDNNLDNQFQKMILSPIEDNAIKVLTQQNEQILLKNSGVSSQHDRQGPGEKNQPQLNQLDQLSEQEDIPSFTVRTSRISGADLRRFETEDEKSFDSSLRVKKLSKSKPKKPSKANKQPARNTKPAPQQNNQPSLRGSYKVQASSQKVTTVKPRQIPAGLLPDFFTDHFDHLPRTIRKINTYKKQELIKQLQQHHTFCILQYIKQSVSLGMVVVIHNENKQKYRSLEVVHIGPYDEVDFLELLLNAVRFCFKADPCEQITLSHIYEKNNPEELQFVKLLEAKFDPYGAIFQKNLFESQFQRKYVIRRNFGEQFKGISPPWYNKGRLLVAVNSFLTQANSSKESEYITQADQYEQYGVSVGHFGLVSYLLSRRFSQQALALVISHGTTKQSTPLQKSLGLLARLALAIKKSRNVRILEETEVEQQNFNNIMGLNLQLINRKEAVLSFPPDQIERQIGVTWLKYTSQLQLSYQFQAQIAKVRIPDISRKDYDEFECRFLRFTPNKKNKMFKLKSKLYSAEAIVLPCKSNKYKLFIMDSQQYDGMSEQQRVKNNGEEGLDLNTYMKLFFANLGEHEVPTWQHIWIPEIQTEVSKNQITGLSSFCEAEHQLQLANTSPETHRSHLAGVIKSQINLTYSSFLPNSLVHQPSHRDLVITPPFILGVLNMQMETCQEGSPVLVQRIDRGSLSWLKQIKKPGYDD